MYSYKDYDICKMYSRLFANCMDDLIGLQHCFQAPLNTFRGIICELASYVTKKNALLSSTMNLLYAVRTFYSLNASASHPFQIGPCSNFLHPSTLFLLHGLPGGPKTASERSYVPPSHLSRSENPSILASRAETHNLRLLDEGIQSA
jgi:hypothetical protein